MHESADRAVFRALKPKPFLNSSLGFCPLFSSFRPWKFPRTVRGEGNNAMRLPGAMLSHVISHYGDKVEFLLS